MRVERRETKTKRREVLNEIQTGRKNEMVSFLNTFLSYVVLMLIIVVVAAAGFALGMFLRKKKNVSMPNTEEHKE